MTAHTTLDKVSTRASDLGARASDLGARAQVIASDNVLPALQSAAATAQAAQQKATDTALPALQATVLPKVQAAAAAVADVAKDRGGELWLKVTDAVGENEQAQELARRAALVAAGAKGESPRRWPLLVAGIATGVAIGTLLGRKTAPTPPPAAVDPTVAV